ncbi:MAG TPA: protein kinase, partial [Anaeromyxobacteraceae bacterium]|nr:protein kinase [Anaeromyxobacteraceae bacterium]
TLFEVGRSDHGPFLVFEFLRGSTLQARMNGGALPVRDAVHVATEIARGLAHAHAEGIVHRDLTPSNVFVTVQGHVKILDFGMAHAFGRRRISGGTPAYMAPEQWEDDPEDERTDVFALGVMLYRMLSGEYPYPEGKGRWATEPGTPRRLDVPGAPELAELVAGMLDQAPKGRPRDGAAVLAALAPIDDRLRARPAGGEAPERARRRKATLGDLLAELKRRHVFRVMIGYGVFAFAVLQVTEPIMHGAGLPDWVLKAVLVALALGFPVAVVLAWVYDLTAQGVRRTPSAAGPGAARLGGSRVLLPLAVSGVVLVLAAAGAAGWYAWKRAGVHRPDAAGAVTTTPAASPSIAVLPFADMSPSRDLEYFGDGIAEEVLNALAQVPGLKVIGRTSSFSFKGKAEDLRSIGQKLNAEAILEGSIRKDGASMRITAQLVRASDGVHLWSQRFDSAQGNVFAVQDEIARAVASALRVKLLPGQDLEARWIHTSRPEAYQAYLLARSFHLRDTVQDYRRELEALRRAVEIDPGYAAAWAAIPGACGALRASSADGGAGCAAEALAAADRAVQLAPDLPQAHVARAKARWDFASDRAGAVADFATATALRSAAGGAPGADAQGGGLKAEPGARVAWWRARVDRDPLSTRAWSGLASAYILAGDFVPAREALGRSLEVSPANVDAVVLLTWVLASQGRHEELLAMASGLPTTADYEVFVLTARAIALRGQGRAREAQASLDTLIQRWSDLGAYQIAQVYAWWGETDRAFGWLDRAYANRDAGLGYLPADPLVGGLRKDPRWSPFVEKALQPWVWTILGG